MIEIGKDESGEGQGSSQASSDRTLIQLDEKSSDLKIFFNSLVPRKWEKTELFASEVCQLLKMGDKYQAFNSASYISCMVEISVEKKNGSISCDWSFSEVMVIYHYGTEFNIYHLRNLAARKFVLLGDILSLDLQDQSARLASHHLLDLLIFKKRWNDFSSHQYFRNLTCKSNNSCGSFWDSQVKPRLRDLKTPPSPIELCMTHQTRCREAFESVAKEWATFSI